MEKLYWVWDNMKDRCNNPKHRYYKDYGGRGITICVEWNDYKVFKKWALNNGYNENADKWQCTLDRINSNGNYEPSNCRWVSMKEQNRNRRNNKIIWQCDLNRNKIKQFNSIADAAEELNMDRANIRKCCNGQRKTCGGFMFIYDEDN